MKYLLVLLMITLLLSCHNRGTTNFYLGSKTKGFFYTKKYYTLAEKVNDSLIIWYLNYDDNGGYYDYKKDTIPFKTGYHGDSRITIKKIGPASIECSTPYSDGTIRLVQENSTRQPYRIINIIHMMEIDKESEKYIQEKSSRAERNSTYISDNFNPDKQCEKLTPSEFERYYRTKSRLAADSMITALDKK